MEGNFQFDERIVERDVQEILEGIHKDLPLEGMLVHSALVEPKDVEYWVTRDYSVGHLNVVMVIPKGEHVMYRKVGTAPVDFVQSNSAFMHFRGKDFEYRLYNSGLN